ncbi:hypothetical protein HZY97_03965 [Sphingomonas sp. R-74633]|uniref:hypothetical protein n=1 Tax=Sphingomonas sp. R-74633 TaxID=2751188 RepID=UPI0015D40537|nr:hypothetical protein [Sphingomonas sp. R-74633]NYT39901.1 hypothetical protein [Sphingomonas sp. R-74633]
MTWIGALLLATSAEAQHGAQPQSPWAVQLPYRTNGAGVGGGDVTGQIRIAPGTEQNIASRALVQTLQQMHFTVARPQLGVAGVLAPRQRWESDTVEVPRAMIDVYNRSVPQMQLPNARYGLQFKGEYDIAYGRFRYKISAQLFERGSLASSWRRVQDSRYAGDFFVGELARLMLEELKRSGLPDR